jgi:hypothetical protein
MTQPSYEDFLAQFQELNTIVHALREENQSLREAMLLRQTPTIADPQTPQQSSTVPQRPRARLPDPTPFSGEDPALYPQFEAKLTAKIEVDKDAIGNNYQLMWYAFSRLEGKAAARVLPWIQAKQETDPNSLTWDTFKSFLRTTFSDPERRTKAISRLNTIKQRGKGLTEFLGEFDQLLLEAGGLTWDDEVKKGYLNSSLNVEILKGLVGTQEAASYEDYCRQLQKIDEQIKKVKRADWKNTNRENRKETSEAEIMEWEPTQAAFGSTRGYENHRKLGLCFRCGGKGHKAMNCDAKVITKNSLPQNEQRVIRGESGKESP